MVQEGRILPVALGVPLLLIAWIAFRYWQSVYAHRLGKNRT
jgi:hypothetical protein